MNAKKQWTVLGYLAGENNLNGAAIDDINEMEAVGSGADVDVLVQIDYAQSPEHTDERWRSTRRYLITKGSDRKRITSRLLDDLGQTNTGDPRALQSFVRYGAKNHPSEKTMLVLWNHGSGFYVPPEMRLAEDGPTTRELSRAQAKLKRSFFHTTRAEILNKPPAIRGILYDDGSSDCLDNRELKSVVAYTEKKIGKKIDVLGMDACLMTMLEVAYQVKDHASVLVGSEETEPAAGWPYAEVLGDLAKDPSMSGADLAKAIVGRYIASYPTGAFAPSVTQSALDLTKLGDLTSAVDELARQLLQQSSNEEKGIILLAGRRSTNFYDHLYVDLHDFAENLAALSKQASVQSACRGVIDAIEGRGATTPIIAEKHAGKKMERVRGISIYMPPTWLPSAYYEELDFAKKTRWGDFLKSFLQ